MSHPSVLFEVKNHVGWIRLNRPNVLNSLNVEMVRQIYSKLMDWKNDDSVSIVCISGEGEKGLCAGGDMRALYDLRESHVTDTAFDFFLTEYLMDISIHHYSKPVLVYMNGIVMGGGVGLSVGASHRIVTEKTKWAMPEMNIGFYPDVGASYFLNKMPSFTGRYLALTSEVIKASDVIYVGMADHYLDSQDWSRLKSEMLQKKWKNHSVKEELTDLIKNFSQPVETSSSHLAVFQEKINKHFSLNTMEDILLSLEKDAKKGDEWARVTLKTLLKKSPTSLKVTLLQLQKSESLSLVDCFKMEFVLSMNFMKNPDFYEGVRSVLVDKDRSPHWKYSRIEDVTDENVLSFFKWNKEWGEENTVLSKFDVVSHDRS